jgi:PAS domain S-box-containing protein
MKREKVANYTFWYFLLGLLLGLFLAFIGTLIVVAPQPGGVTATNIVRAALTTPILWFVYVLAFLLAVALAIAGSRQRKLVQSRQEERIAIRRASEYQKQLGDLSRKDQERQEVETVISRGKKEWEATFDSVDDMLLLTDENGVITRCNRASAQAFRSDFLQLIGRNVDELFFGAQPGEANRIPIQKTEMKFPTLPGWYEVSSSQVVSEGLQHGTLYVVRNITDRKQAGFDLQRQKIFYETLVNNSPVAIVTLNLDQRVMTCNPTFEKMFGYNQQEIAGQDLDSLIAPFDLYEETRAYTTSVRQGEKVHAVSRRKVKDGSLIDVEIFGIPVILGGKQVGILAMYHDVSYLVRAQPVPVAMDEWQPVQPEAEAPLEEEAVEPAEAVEEQVVEAEAPLVEAAGAPAARKYKVEEIEGIGPAYAAILSGIGILTTEDLLDAAATRKGRADLAEKTSISEKLVLKWANRADLMRVPGIGEEYSDLLEAAGVDTVKELRKRIPENLHDAILKVNERDKLVRRPPHLSEVQAWVEAAKTIEPKMLY